MVNVGSFESMISHLKHLSLCRSKAMFIKHCNHSNLSATLSKSPTLSFPKTPVTNDYSITPRLVRIIKAPYMEIQTEFVISRHFLAY